jgi:hypothetical protein
VVLVVWTMKRIAARKTWCAARGYTYSSRGVGPNIDGLFPMFVRGHTQYIGASITGVYENHPFCLFEHVTVSGHGKHRHTHHQTIVCFQQLQLPTPAFTLTPEGWLSKLGNLFGTQDIDFPEDPQFSKAFQLRGQPEQALREHFNADRRNQLRASGRLHLGGAHDTFIWWMEGSLPSADSFDAMLAAATTCRRVVVGV